MARRTVRSLVRYVSIWASMTPRVRTVPERRIQPLAPRLPARRAQSKHVEGRLTVGELFRWISGTSVATQIGDDDPIAPGQFRNLTGKDCARSVETVEQNQGFTLAGRFVIHFDAVERGGPSRDLSALGMPS